MMAPLVLAYVGDAVFEVFVRNHLVLEKNVSVNALHKSATKYVKAKAQAKIVHTLEPELTEVEWTVVKRGRNQKSATVPKNADLTDYRYATGFEALLGYLFYTGSTERLMEIMAKGIAIINGEIPANLISNKEDGGNHES
nr:ribonuclease III domain-containing protein [Alkaliphilus hydrothermalis]